MGTQSESSCPACPAERSLIMTEKCCVPHEHRPCVLSAQSTPSHAKNRTITVSRATDGRTLLCEWERGYVSGSMSERLCEWERGRASECDCQCVLFAQPAFSVSVFFCVSTRRSKCPPSPHCRSAKAAWDGGFFSEEVVPVEVKSRKGSVTVSPCV